jgi:hypothetical protein
MKTYAHLCQYLIEFFLEWEMCQTKFAEKIKTPILYLITFFQKSSHLWDNVEHYGRARQATDDCWLTNAMEYEIFTALPL